MKRKILSLTLLAALLLAAMLPLSALAAEGTDYTVSVSASAQEVKAGDTVSFTVSFAALS